MNRKGLAVAGGMAMAWATSVAHAAGPQPAVNLPRLVAGLGLTEAGARTWLERLGVTVAGPPMEHLLVVRPTGEDVLARRGSASSVRVDAELDEFLLRPGMGNVLVHNHPTSVGLSGPDLGQLAKPGVAAVIAIGDDGSVFAAAAGPRMHPDFLESRQYSSAKAEVAKRLRAEAPSGGVPVAVSDAHSSHLVSLAMAKAGIIDYWFRLRGANRESYEAARVVFGHVVVSAAARLKTSVRGRD